MAAGERLERQVPGGGERRLGGRDQLWRNGRRVARRICHGVDRYWTRRWARYIRPRSPEKLIDFAWRSEHEMTVQAKALIHAFYGAAPKRSYWNGCSTGGRQGLKEAQMFPNDYDGVIAGAPANRTAISLWIAHAVLKDPASYVPPAKYPAIHAAALAACDAADGLKDGLIDDPSTCGFDPAVLLCK